MGLLEQNPTLRRNAHVSALILALAGFSHEAHAQSLFGGTGRLPYRDITRSPELRDKSLDYEYIAGNRPTYAESRLGLAGAPTVEVRRNYVYVEDSDASLTIPYRSSDDLFESFNFALREVYSVLPHEFVFVYLFTSFETGVGAFFYQPEANTTRGMGEFEFDGNGPNEPREGFVFMNYWGSFDGITGGGQQFDRDYGRAVFNQEAGHRWGSFIEIGAGNNGQGPDILLGRDEGHWSYFMHSSGSPMEGNSWRDNGGGSFTTTTRFDNFYFNELDLYLMGMLPPEEVDPFFVITSPQIPQGARDLFGQQITKSSPPQIVEPLTVSGTRVDIEIETVTSRMGMRLPRFGDAPTNFRVVFVMLAGSRSAMTETQKTNFEDMVDDYALGFASGTANRGSLDYVLMETPTQPVGGPCQQHRECEGEGSVCLTIPPVPTGEGVCTRFCNNAGECPSDFCCQPASSGAQVCLPTPMCAVVEPPDAGMAPACACDVTAGACDQGCDCDTTCTSSGNDAGTNPNPDPGATCACDLTTVCDDGCGHCDPECLAAEEDGGCAAVEVPADRTGLFMLIAFGLFVASSRTKKKK